MLDEKFSRFRINQSVHLIFLAIKKMITIYLLIAGIVLCTLGILMIFGQPRFLLLRYEWFQKLFRKNMKNADRKLLSKYYSLLFFVSGIPLTIGAIIGLIVPNTFEVFYLWLIISVVVIGVSIVIYINISKRFIQFERNADSDWFSFFFFKLTWFIWLKI